MGKATQLQSPDPRGWQMDFTLNSTPYFFLGIWSNRCFVLLIVDQYSGCPTDFEEQTREGPRYVPGGQHRLLHFIASSLWIF